LTLILVLGNSKVTVKRLYTIST